ncbi:dna repair enzyme, partial [Nannochloropsis oceanica]
MATVGAAATAASRAEVLHESLDLRVDLEKREVKGHATVWVLLPPLPAGDLGTVDEGVMEYRLHARQMEIHEVKVNDMPASYMYPHPVDLLRDFVPPGSEDIDDREKSGSSARMDGEALDLHYRCQLIASQEGELSLQLPKRQSWRPPPSDVQEEGDETVKNIPQVVLNAGIAALRICKIEIDYRLQNPVAGLRFDSHPAHAYSMRCPSVLHDFDGPRCWFPCADRTTDIFTLDMVVAVVSPASSNRGEVGNGDTEANDREGNHVGKVDIVNDSGTNSSSRASTTISNSSTAINRDEEHPVVVLVGGGQLLGKERKVADGTVVWRYAIETPITASAVSLVVGHFGKYVDPGVPRLTHHYLLREERRAATFKASNGRNSLPTIEKPLPPPPPPRSWVSHSVEGMGPAMSFLADFFHLAPGGGEAATGSAPTPSVVVPYLEHRIVFVKGLPEASMAFHGLSLHRVEDVHPPRVFDHSMTFHLALAEGLFASWLLPRVRPRFTRDRWIYHGVLGYLVLMYVRRRYGEHEYRYRLLRLMDAVTALERSGQSTPLLPPDSVLLASEIYSPASLELVRVKPPVIMHMIEQRVGRKSLRDVLRSVACPTPVVSAIPAAASGGGGGG